MWDNPTMSISTVDTKKRVILPSGDVFDIQQQAEGRFLLIRLEKPERAERMSRRACNDQRPGKQNVFGRRNLSKLRCIVYFTFSISGSIQARSMNAFLGE